MNNKTIVKSDTRYEISPKEEEDFFKKFSDAFECLNLYNLSYMEKKAVILSYFKNDIKYPIFRRKGEFDYTYNGINSVGSDLFISFAGNHHPYTDSSDFEDQIRKNRGTVIELIINQFGPASSSFYRIINELKNKRGLIAAQQKSSFLDKIRLKRVDKNIKENEIKLNETLQRKIKEGMKIMDNIQLPSYFEYLKSLKLNDNSDPKRKSTTEEIKLIIEDIKIVSGILKKTYEAEQKVKAILAKYEKVKQQEFLSSGINLNLLPNIIVLQNMRDEINDYYLKLLEEEKEYNQTINPLQVIEEIKGIVSQPKPIRETIDEIMEMATYLDVVEHTKRFLEEIKNNYKDEEYISQLYEFYFGCKRLYKKKIDQQKAESDFKDLMASASKISSF